jgi:hypothetical protein
LILEPAPAGFEGLAVLDAARPAIVLTDDDGRELVISDSSGELHVRLHHDDDGARPAILLPADASYELRRDVATRFVRHLRGHGIKLLPQALRLTAQRRHRLVQLLHAFDIHDLGGGPRDVAEIILRSEHARFPSVEWKDSHARRAANRLIHDSISLVNRGYLKLLRGG